MAGALRVTCTVTSGAFVSRTVTAPCPPSESTSEPSTGATTTVGSSLSMISAAMPSTGRPTHALPGTVLSTEWRMRPVCPSRSSAWTAGAALPTSTLSEPRPPKMLSSIAGLVESTWKTSSPSMP